MDELPHPARRGIQGVDYSIIKEFIASLPFELTTAQKKVIKENIESLHSGKPMMRLLQ